MKPLEDSFCISEATLLKNETDVFEDSFCVSVATSLKNETEVMSIILVSVSSSLKNAIVFPLSL
jgi:hypothetical protein